MMFRFLSSDKEEFSPDRIRDICEDLSHIQIKGTAGLAIADTILQYSPRTLKQMRWNFSEKIRDYPPEYREKLEETITAHLHGTYQHVRLMHQQGTFSTMTDLLDPGSPHYWHMVSVRCTSGDGNDSVRFLKYLLSGFCMFIQKIPGHPVGMPFPGGDVVDLIDGIYYCPVREKAHDVDSALCPYCPALQTPEIGYLKPPVHASEQKKQAYIRNCYDYHHFNG